MPETNKESQYLDKTTFWKVFGITIPIIVGAVAYLNGQLAAFKDDYFKELRSIGERTATVEQKVEDINSKFDTLSQFIFQSAGSNKGVGELVR